MVIINYKKLDFVSSLYEFVNSFISNDEIIKIKEKYNITDEYKDKDELVDYILSMDVTDEEVINFILADRKNQYFVFYHERLDQFQLFELI